MAKAETEKPIGGERRNASGRPGIQPSRRLRQIRAGTRWRYVLTYGLFSLDKVMKKAKTTSNPLS
jgi:hypothetical protein